MNLSKKRIGGKAGLGGQVSNFEFQVRGLEIGNLGSYDSQEVRVTARNLRAIVQLCRVFIMKELERTLDIYPTMAPSLQGRIKQIIRHRL